MHVLMLGWEFPPFITGGLGTACFGLTKAMDRRGMQVTFVVPKALESATASHVRLLAPLGGEAEQAAHPAGQPPGGSSAAGIEQSEPPAPAAEGTQVLAGNDGEGQSAPASRPGQPASEQFENVRFIDVPATFQSPYENWPEQIGEKREVQARDGGAGDAGASGEAGAPGNAAGEIRRTASRVGQWSAPAALMDGGEHGSQSAAPPPAKGTAAGDYDGDIIGEVERYAHFVLGATRHLDFDIIHAHDWMTYPAGMMLARATGKPLVVHIHSTEFDRSGEHVNQRIYDIERRGMNSALRVIAVSQLTKNMVVSRYAVPSNRVEVVYNGVDLEPSQVGITGIRSKDKIVLYFGRITHQKGPEYFIRAAKRVLEVMGDVKFVVAGSGDMAKRMIEMAAELGIGHKVLFTGFLRGRDIARVFNMADLYVMPSVSEPFGIAPLEAMSHNVPALISKSSGVSEVLLHALKVDFWDVDDMANKIVAVLRHPPLHQTLQEHGSFEVRRLTWDGAAQRCEQVYEAVLGEMVAHPTG